MSQSIPLALYGWPLQDTAAIFPQEFGLGQAFPQHIHRVGFRGRRRGGAVRRVDHAGHVGSGRNRLRQRKGHARHVVVHVHLDGNGRPAALCQVRLGLGRMPGQERHHLAFGRRPNVVGG